MKKKPAHTAESKGKNIETLGYNISHASVKQDYFYFHLKRYPEVDNYQNQIS